MAGGSGPAFFFFFPFFPSFFISYCLSRWFPSWGSASRVTPFRTRDSWMDKHDPLLEKAFIQYTRRSPLRPDAWLQAVGFVFGGSRGREEGKGTIHHPYKLRDTIILLQRMSKRFLFFFLSLLFNDARRTREEVTLKLATTPHLCLGFSRILATVKTC